MNKQTFLELMKAPEKISEADFVELETLVKANPYFQNGHSILAHAGKKLKKASSPKKMSTAAIYATNRNIFKQYILGQVKFSQSQSSTATTATPPKATLKPLVATSPPPTTPRKAPTHNTDEEQDALVKEIYENLEKWKASREHYLEYDKRHPEEIVIEDPFATSEPKETITEPEVTAASEPEVVEEIAKPEVEEIKTIEPDTADDKAQLDEVEKLKNQVAEEIEAEEETISQALSEITEKSKKEPIAEEPKSVEKPQPTIPTFSSDDLTAIVDAESSMDDSDAKAEKSQDTVDDIEQSIERETK